LTWFTCIVYVFLHHVVNHREEHSMRLNTMTEIVCFSTCSVTNSVTTRTRTNRVHQRSCSVLFPLLIQHGWSLARLSFRSLTRSFKLGWIIALEDCLCILQSLNRPRCGGAKSPRHRGTRSARLSYLARQANCAGNVAQWIPSVMEIRATCSARRRGAARARACIPSARGLLWVRTLYTPV